VGIGRLAVRLWLLGRQVRLETDGPPVFGKENDLSYRYLDQTIPMRVRAVFRPGKLISREAVL